MNYIYYLYVAGWLKSVGTRIVYELDYSKPILYVVPVQSILGKLPVVLGYVINWRGLRTGSCTTSRKVPCERAASSPCSGHAPACTVTVRPVRVPFGSPGCAAVR
jgi:hypothetical protein